MENTGAVTRSTVNSTENTAEVTRSTANSTESMTAHDAQGIVEERDGEGA
eukprot:CAMPEP_0181345694 /NCGR_PEP_ID=MMETSP1101-20121128/32898_1 /TAXON_ID=46948 /ORGANISM="Rhodomonas abbreviata, Strain Caron Lab Isolate" /LENGTH=49 /DNA_ID= /DNA_START= /DNA_END= /DNA_ORIENTATION=